jgi:hypothetical protein
MARAEGASANMIYSGLDWSGSPGRGQGPLLVFAAAHIDRGDVPPLDAELAAAKTRLGLPPTFVFSHNGASPRTLAASFDAIARVPVTAHVHLLDKTAWGAQQVGKPKGADCLCDGIVTLAQRCPDSVVARQILYIDLPGNEEGALTRYRTEIRRALRAARPRRAGFSDVRPCPDHRLQGGLIQVADAIAGEVRIRNGLSGPNLLRLGSAVMLV